MPNSRDKWLRMSVAVAPSGCALTACRVASLKDTLAAACWPPRALRCGAGCRGSSCRASSPPSFGCIGTAAKSRQNTFGDLQFIELISQLCPFGINPRQPLGNPLLFLPNLVQRRHLVYPSSSPNSEPDTLLRRYSPINGGLAHRKKAACKKLLLFDVGRRACRTAIVTVATPSRQGCRSDGAQFRVRDSPPIDLGKA